MHKIWCVYPAKKRQQCHIDPNITICSLLFGTHRAGQTAVWGGQTAVLGGQTAVCPYGGL